SALTTTSLFAAEAQQEKAVERISVTGSHIRQNDMEGPSPVLSIDADDIANSGAQDISELLSKLSVAGQGTFSTQGNDADDTSNGGSAISLRGLGADSTLVLLNGRRISVSAFAKNIGTAFVDINSIPVSAIARIDILKDGASATYGSDAIAGVVNIILKKDFSGLEMSASIADTTEAGGKEKSFSILWGNGDEKGHTTVIIDYFDRDGTMFADRDYSKSADQSARGGADQRSSSGNPGTYIPATIGADGSITTKSDLYDRVPDINCPAELLKGTLCRYDYAPLMSSVPATERAGIVIMHESAVGEDTKFFAEASYQRNSSVVKGAASPSFNEFYMLKDNPNLQGTWLQDLFPGEDITMRRRLTETGGRQKEAVSNSSRIVLGFKGIVAFNAGEWDWETGYTFSHNSNQEFGQSGFVQTSKIQQAIADGSFNPLSTTQPQSVIDAITVNTTRNGKSSTKSFDAKISGELFDVAAGTVAMAIGAEYREEKMEDLPDQMFLNGDIFGTEATASSGERDQTSLFIEFGVPITDDLEMQLALRYEDYSDFGTNVSPKIAFRWAASEDVTLRASWGEAFRAPSLVQLGLGEAQQSPNLVDTLRCPLTGADEDCDPIERTVIYTGNENLKAEESESFNIGVIWSVTDQLSIGVDYWNYDQENLVTLDPKLILNNPLTNNDPAFVKREPSSTAIPGRIVEIYDTYRNLGGQKTDGLDVDINYTLADTNAGDFKVGLSLTWINNFEEIDAEGTARDLNGQYQHPEYRWTTSVDWNKNDFAAAARINYIGEYADDADAGATGMVDSMVTLDTNVSYFGLKNTRLTFGVNNLLNEEPPFGTTTFMGYDQQTHSAQGRFWYLKGTYTF
ncbi:MAG: TonB-dependent receptor, partial [Gammaproteobacteria bacterium]|nr:TonB-dependent receptor [Gammaproteobacteria bacterium]